MIKNILFDLDGVLFEGCEFHAELFIRAANTIKQDLNLKKEYHDRVLNGMTTKQKLNTLNLSREDSEKISTLKQKLTKESILHYVKPDQIKKDMCKRLFSLKYRLFCVSNSIRSTVETCLNGLEIMEYFSGIISNEDTLQPKPSPLPYLTAFAKWSLDPKESVIVEDSPHGIHSARMSGGHVMAVSGVHEVSLERVLKFVNDINS
jgi:HAD superfamily hydrolase (TIGR01509 family)